MKKIVLLLISVLLTVCFSSCTKRIPTKYDELFIVVKNGRYGLERRQNVVECKFDTMYYATTYYSIDQKTGKKKTEKGTKSALFIGELNGERFYFDNFARPLCDGNPVIDERLFIGKLFNGQASLGDGLFSKFLTKKGFYVYEMDAAGYGWYLQDGVGPYEDIYIGIYGYSIQQKGKWGFIFGRKDVNLHKHSKNKAKFQQIVPCEYDGIIEVLDMSPTAIDRAHVSSALENVILGRKGKKNWVGFNEKGQSVKISVPVVLATLKTKEWSPSSFDPFQRFRLGEKVRRTGDDTRGVFVFK